MFKILTGLIGGMGIQGMLIGFGLSAAVGAIGAGIPVGKVAYNWGYSSGHTQGKKDGFAESENAHLKEAVDSAHRAMGEATKQLNESIAEINQGREDQVKVMSDIEERINETPVDDTECWPAATADRVREAIPERYRRRQ